MKAVSIRLPASIETPAIEDSHFPMARIAEAMRYQVSGKHFGKIVIDITPG